MKKWVERLFLLLVFSLGFAQPAARIAGLKASPPDFIFPIVFAGLIVLLIRRLIDLKFDPSYLFLAAYALALLLSATFSSDRPASFLKFVGELYLISLPLLAIHLVQDRRMLRATVFTWLAASGIVSAISVVTVLLFYVDRSNVWHEFFLHHYGSLPAGNYPRIQSTFHYPAMLANFLNVSINLLLAAWFSGWIRRSFAAVLLGVHLITLIFTVTPGLGAIAITLGVWAAIWLFKNGKPQAARAAGAFGGIGATAFLIAAAVTIWPVATSPFWFDAFGVRLDPSQRMLAWIGAFETFLSYPIFGKGVGLPVTNVLFAPPTGDMQSLTDAHNTILSVAAQAGIVGAAALVSLTVHTLYRSRTIKSNGGDLSYIRIGLLVAFAASFVYEGLFGSFENGRHLWVLIGLIFAASRMSESEG